MKRVGIGPRLAAVSLDSAFAWAGGGLSGFFFRNLFHDQLQQKVMETGGKDVAELGSGMVEFYSLLVSILIGILCFNLLSGLLEAFTGASIGKRLMKIRKLLLRAVLKHVSFVFFLFTLLTGIQFYAVLGGLMGVVVAGGMFLILSQEKQTLYDRIAETAVYEIFKPDSP